MSEPERIPCRHLRTKMAYIHDETGRTYLQVTRPDESYWCMRTLTAIGYDDAPAEPDDCDAGRSCYQPLPAQGTVTIRRRSSSG